jgi:nitrate/nitrite transporter NarK
MFVINWLVAKNIQYVSNKPLISTQKPIRNVAYKKATTWSFCVQYFDVRGSFPVIDNS